MNFAELIVLAIGLSMDAFAISICKGLSVEKLEKRHMVITGLWFGGSQMAMPIIGYFVGGSFYEAIQSVDHWLSFALLLLIGVNMIRESMGKIEKLDASFSPKVMFPLAIADSICLPAGAAGAVSSGDRSDDVSVFGGRRLDRQPLRRKV